MYGGAAPYPGVAYGSVLPPLAGVGARLGALLFDGVASLVFFVPVARSGRTPGRRLFGIRVIDARTLAPPSAGKALGRYLFETWVSAQVCYLGLLWAVWDPEKRTWHDMVCDTRVVRA